MRQIIKAPTICSVEGPLKGLFQIGRQSNTPQQKRSTKRFRSIASVETITARIVNYLLARALVAEYRGNSFMPFIVLARFVARFAERRAA